METFFILAVLVFLPFGWFILRMLRFTNETVGEDSPLHKERTYQVTATQYFGDFTKVLIAILLLMSIALSYIMSEVAFRQEPLAVAFGVFFLGFAGFLCYYLYFDWQFWTITRNVVLTLNPFQPSVTIEGPGQCTILMPDTVSRIEHHLIKVDNSRNPFSGYGYYLFYTKDGQTTRLNTIFFSNIGHFEFLERLFGQVPQAIVWHPFPWNPDFNPVEKLESPNFDS